MKRGAIGGLIVAAALAAPAAANASTTWCVQDPSCPSAGNTTQTTIQGAVNAAASGDTVLIGPGKFSEQVTQSGSKALTLIGAGPTQTVIQSPNTNTTTLNLGGSAGDVVENLGVELPPGPNGVGLETNGDSVGVAITAPSGATNGQGVKLLGGNFDRGSIILPVGGTATTTGVAPLSVPGGAVQDSTIVATSGAFGILTLARDRIQATQAVTDLNDGSSGGLSPTFVVDDVLIQTLPGPSPERAISFTADAGPVAPFAQFLVRHATLFGSGAGGSTGIAATSTASPSNSVNASAVIDSTIVRGYSTSVSRTATGSGANSAAQSTRVDYSDLDTTTETDTTSGATSGALTNGTHNVNVDPGFANTIFGDPLGFHLLTTSQLVDSGNPALGGGESATDADGAPRAVGGRVGALPLSDIGAFEYQPHPPIVAITANPVSGVATKPIVFTANASDPDPGDSLTYAWSFDDGVTSTGPTASHAFATAGTHQATVTVHDLDGFTVSAAASITVAPAVSPGVISNLRLSRRSFAAAPAGHTIVPARVYGTVVSYMDSQAATTTFTVQRPSVGRRLGRFCLKLGKHRRNPAPCTRYTSVGSFTHNDSAGANKFRFTGRVRGHKLKPGSYRLRAIASDSAGLGAPAFVSFRVTR